MQKDFYFHPKTGRVYMLTTSSCINQGELAEVVKKIKAGRYNSGIKWNL